MRRPRAFTLIEGMVLVAAVGLLSAIGVATYQRFFSETPPHNAAKDLVQTLESARARAKERNSDVWVVVYPGFNKRANTVSAGRGATFVLDAPFDYAAFDPITEQGGEPIEAVFLEHYGGRIRFRLPTARLELTEPPLVLTAACTFCTAGSRGAIVCAADGSLRFLDGSGEQVKGDAHAVTLISDRNKHTSVVAVSRDGVIAPLKK